MIKKWVVWVDITHRIEVEAEDMDVARDIATEEHIWDVNNMVDCNITVEQIDDD